MDDGFERDRKSDPVAGVVLADGPFTPPRFGPNAQPIKEDPFKRGGILQQRRDDPNAACE